MNMEGHRSARFFKSSLAFDPEQGRTILQPVKPEANYWVGAPSVARDERSGAIYLYYRERQPRPIRGGRCAIGRSEDGVHFSTIWEVRKEALNTTSIEKSSLFQMPSGEWFLYLSYVDSADQRWRVDVLRAGSPEKFDITQREKVFTASDIACEGVKDPYAFAWDGWIYLILSYAPTPPGLTEAMKEAMHGTSDVYNTGLSKSATGLARSRDGVRFEWLGEVFGPSESGWDRYASRIGSLLYLPPVFVGIYDGSASVEENYEERTGLAVSLDLRNWSRLTHENPWMVSPHGTGSLRYMDILERGEDYWVYYEYRRADGAHDLRLSVVNRGVV